MSEPLIEKNPIILAFMQKQKPIPYSLMSLKLDENAKEQVYNKALIECAEIVLKAPTIDSVPAAPRWVRCEERLPDDSRDVIIFHTSGIVGVGSFIRPNWYQWYSGGGLPVDVTHWMPLPEPPKEAADGEQ